MHTYQLKIIDGRTVVWEGKDGPDACRRWNDCHGKPGWTFAIAWRDWPRQGVFAGSAAQIKD